ncbi:MAG: gamma-glutamylcyclotransferase [Aestuariivirga sp.]
MAGLKKQHELAVTRKCGLAARCHAKGARLEFAILALQYCLPMNGALRLTQSHVRLVHREIADPGPLPGMAHFTDEDYEAHIGQFMGERPEGPIYVFAYGSLIWRPAFLPASVAKATAPGWHRSFCLRLLRWRGTLDVPGLMMQIDAGGVCEGVIQEVAAEDELAVLHGLWRREMTIKPPGNLPRWIDVEAGGRKLRAIAFTANPESPLYAGALAPDTVAERLATACGQWGSGAEYLLHTIASLEREGIHDPYLWDLQERVAMRIERSFPDACLG